MVKLNFLNDCHFKGKIMQMEKVPINDRLHVLKVF